MHLHKRAFPALAVACAALWGAPAAGAAEVIVIDGERAEVRHDPVSPGRSETSLGRARGRGPSAQAAASPRGQRAVMRALRKARRAGKLSAARQRRYRRAYLRARSVRRRLTGTRGRQLGYVISIVDRLARRRRLTSSRLRSTFLQLSRNTQFWRRHGVPGADVKFRGSELLYRYFTGHGLQIHPLANFVKANKLHGACTKGTGSCSRRRLRRLLDELSKLAVRRHRRFVAWEYQFHFGGGSPPWMSGMAQGTAIQALARGSQLLHRPRYLATARKALRGFSTRPPAGVKARGPLGGRHYLQYSFDRRLFIFNAFTQSLIGLFDYAEIAGSSYARRLFELAEPELTREIPKSDLGDWTRYSWRGRESTPDYHELLREVAQSACNRKFGRVYCTLARRYRGYQTDPPEIELTGPATASEDSGTRIRFSLSKLSTVEVKVYKGSSLAFRRIATFRRGNRSFGWTPKSPGTYTIRLGAKEQRTGKGLKGRDSGTVLVE